ncbi:serine/threonine-protein kinase [Streptomyces sp. NPDC089799]|uniref:serine/threonine-protein kinase n=1 Tax=Streptomyces sp. NPDC089799 TaxID=3155066 RepID=UPI00343BF35C
MDTSEGGRRLVDGRFELISRLGSGGMGTVWRARDTALQRDVALKEVRPADPALIEARPDIALQLRQRAIREAQALARLAHPNVVSIHHIVEPDDGSHPWIVMELVQGGSLHDRLAQGPLPVDEVVRIGLDVLSALRAAHAAGVHHRDVKPANVLLRPDGSAVLTDFGIAVLPESSGLTATGDLVGSPEYIAPERVRGEEGNPSSDLWSLGMTMYVAAEGVHPLRRATAMATVVAVLDEPLPYPSRSGGLAPVLSELLVRDTKTRPDAARLETLLRAVPASGAPAAVPPTPPAGSPAVGPGHSTGGQPTVPTGYGPMAGYGSPSNGFGPPGGMTTTPVGLGAPAAPPLPPTRRGVPVLVFLVVIGVLLAGAVGTVNWLLPDGDDDAKSSGTTSAGPTGGSGPGSTPSTSGSGPKSSPAATKGGGTGTGTTADDPDDLLTAAGGKAVTAAVRDETGSANVVRLSIYGEYAMVNVPVKSPANGYDSYRYQGGMSRFGPGGTVTDGSEPIDLDKVNWDVLPGLMQQAESKLKVEKPTMRYVLVEPDLFAKDEPRIKIYLTNDYHATGYLTADLNGKVKQVYPASS